MPCSRLLLLLAATLLTSSCAKVVVVKVDGVQPAEGMIYALPNTVVRLQVKLDRAELTGARYGAYAPIFAPEGEVVVACTEADCSAKRQTEYSLQEGTTFSIYGEPDPDNVYLVKFTRGSAVDQTIAMSWNETGLLSSAGASVTNRTSDVAMAGLKMLASFGTKGAFGASVTEGGKDVCANQAPADDFFLPKLIDLGGEASRLLLRNYCAIDAKDRNALYANVPIRNGFDAALRAFTGQVASFINARRLILDGTSRSQEPAQLLSKIEAEINKQLTTLYLGVKNVKTWEGILDVRGIDKAQRSVEVLRLDPAVGFCVSGELAPESKLLPEKFGGSLPNSHACTNKNTKPIAVSVLYHPEEAKQLFSKVKDVGTGDRSFRYRLPAQVVATIGDEKKTYGSAVLSLAQLGTVVSLPAERRSKSLSYDLTFIEATGGLKSFKLGSTGGLDAGTIDALSGVGGTVLDYENARKAGKDELAMLTREAALLKLRDEICTIQQKNGLACTDEPK